LCKNEECLHENDIAARFCEKCKSELVDPNEKLKIEFAKIKKDPYTPTVDKVLSWNVRLNTSQRGNDTLRVTYVTECRSFDVFYMLMKRYEWVPFCMATIGKIVESEQEFMDLYWEGEAVMPVDIKAYREAKGSRFYKVEGYNYEDTRMVS
jgi:DNA repair protein RadD